MKDNEWKKVCAACEEGTPPARCAYYGEPNGCNAPTLGAHPEGDLAERLQEALEKAERRIAELERAPGNAAAMREALENARSKFIHIKKCADEGEVSRKKLAILCDFVSREITAALAAPPRNCDVGDAAEQSDRLAKFCKANYEKAKKDKHICSECRFNDCLGECPLEWAQLPFTPEKGGAE